MSITITITLSQNINYEFYDGSNYNYDYNYSVSAKNLPYNDENGQGNLCTGHWKSQGKSGSFVSDFWWEPWPKFQNFQGVTPLGSSQWSDLPEIFSTNQEDS